MPVCLVVFSCSWSGSFWVAFQMGLWGVSVWVTLSPLLRKSVDEKNKTWISPSSVTNFWICVCHVTFFGVMVSLPKSKVIDIIKTIRLKKTIVNSERLNSIQLILTAHYVPTIIPAMNNINIYFRSFHNLSHECWSFSLWLPIIGKLHFSLLNKWSKKLAGS